MNKKRKLNVKSKFIYSAIFSILMVFLSSIFISLTFTENVQAAVEDTGENLFIKMINECEGFKKTQHEGDILDDISDISPIGKDYGGAPTGKWKDCQEYQDTMKSNLGCENMFYPLKHPEDPSKEINKWYIHAEVVATCLANAKEKINKIASKYCNSMSHSSENDDKDGKAWKDCTKYEEQLHKTLGCSGKMFRKASDSESSRDDIWTQNNDAVNNCKGRIENAQAKKIAGPNGTGGKTIATFTRENGIKGSADSDSGGDSDGKTVTDCDTELSSTLSWILCPLIDIGASLSDAVFTKVIAPLLSDIPISPDRKDPIFIAWQGFRVLANVMLVGSMLALVYAQAKGDK